jgi:hypothetical protein
MEPRSARLLQRRARMRHPMKLIELAIARQNKEQPRHDDPPLDIDPHQEDNSRMGRPIPTREALYARGWTRVEKNEKSAASALIFVALSGDLASIRFHNPSFRESLSIRRMRS